MKYWICIDSDGTQGVHVGQLLELDETPDSNWGDFIWEEISEEEFKMAGKSEEYWNKLLDRLMGSNGYTAMVQFKDNE